MMPLVKSESSSEFSWELVTSLEGDLLGRRLTLQPLTLLDALGPGNLLTNALSMYFARINDSRMVLLLEDNIWLAPMILLLDLIQVYNQTKTCKHKIGILILFCVGNFGGQNTRMQLSILNKESEK